MSEGAIDFQFLAENSADVICRVSGSATEMVMQYVSPSCMRVLGWIPEELTGTRASDFVFPEDMPHLAAAISRNQSSSGGDDPVTVRVRKKDGSLVWIEINPREMRDPVSGESREAVIVMRDVTERTLLEEKLAALAMTDALTGLENRRAFDEALEREWKRTLREGTQMSLLLLDVDHFKRFNDLYGHQVGDDCLRAVGQAAVGAVRQTDIVARYGGEEIAIILPRVDAPGAAEAAEKVRAAVEALRLTHAENPEGGDWLTVSIGAATALARHGGTMRMPESLLLAADHALYKAKHAGRNCVMTGMLIAPRDAVVV
jgi:diguanylate cyclase (GGDEF)-like protein/PAS domain S-box-containing protein